MTDFCAAVLLNKSGEDNSPADFSCAEVSFLSLPEWARNTVRESGIEQAEIFDGKSTDEITSFAKKSGKEFIFLLQASVPYINSSDLSKILKLCKSSGSQVLVVNENGERAAGLAVKAEALKAYKGELLNLLDVYNALGDGGRVTVRCKEVYDGVSLFEFNTFIRNEIIEGLLNSGVNIPCADGIIIDPRSKIGRGTTILPGTIIKGQSIVGENCVIGPNSFVQDTVLGDNVILKASFADTSRVGDNTTIGPFCNLRPNSNLANNVKVGDFVEVKNSNVGEKTSIAHLTYVGDSDVGCHVNFGCGTVTVNYDGKKKYRTVIGNNVFVGCNTNLVAPVTVEDNTYIAAGSTITDNVPEKSLAIARARQVIKENWVTLREEKNK